MFAELAMSQRYSAIFCATGVWGLMLSLDMIPLFSTYKISNFAFAGIELVSIFDIDLRRRLFFVISNFFDGFFKSFFIFLNLPFFFSWSVRLLTSFDFFETKAGFGRIASEFFTDVGESRWRGLGPSLKSKLPRSRAYEFEQSYIKLAVLQFFLVILNSID